MTSPGAKDGSVRLALILTLRAACEVALAAAAAETPTTNIRASSPPSTEQVVGRWARIRWHHNPANEEQAVESASST